MRPVETLHVETVQFEEKGEVVEMEIDDGGQAEQEFNSENEFELGSDMDNENEEHENVPVGTESGEITPNQSDSKDELTFEVQDAGPESPKPGHSKSRESVEQRLDTMSSTLLAMKQIMEKSGLLENTSAGQGSSQTAAPAEGKRKHDKEKQKGKSNEKVSEQVTLGEATSETTIYKNVLQKEVPARHSYIDSGDDEVTFKTPTKAQFQTMQNNSSSDEQVDTSDELLEINMDFNEKFISDCAKEAAASRKESQLQEKEPGPNERANEILRQAEVSKALLLPTPGNILQQIDKSVQPGIQAWGMSAMQHSSLVDEQYTVIGLHVDPGLQDKIKKLEYVDFARLLPRNCAYDDN